MKRQFNYFSHIAVFIAAFYLGISLVTTLTAAAKPAHQIDEQFCPTVAYSGTSFTAQAITATPVFTDDPATVSPAPPLPTNWPYTPTDTPSGDRGNQKVHRSARAAPTDPTVNPAPVLSASDYILAFGMAVSWMVVIAVVWLQHSKDKSVVPGLTGAIVAMSQNRPTVDLLQPVLSQLIPKSAVQSGNRLADFLETLTDDEGDQFIEALRGLANKVTTPPDPGGQASG